MKFLFFYNLNLNFLNPFYFSTFIFLFAFPTVLFPLQLIFNVYKASLSAAVVAAATAAKSLQSCLTV